MPAKILFAKIYSIRSKLYTNIALYILLKPSLSFTNETKVETKHSEMKRRYCSRYATSIYLLKALKKRIVWRYSIYQLIRVLYVCMLFTCIRFSYLYSKNEHVIIPNGRQLPENRKNLFPARKTSFSQSQKLVPAKQKKSPIGKIKLPQKFSATRYHKLRKPLGWFKFAASFHAWNNHSRNHNCLEML